jgi:hypothetical protein
MTETTTAAAVTATAAAQEKQPGVLATLPQQAAAPAVLPTWGATEYLSPVSVFQPNRADICTHYQLATVTGTESAGHLSAAVHHLRAAVDKVGKEETARMAEEIEQAVSELRRLRQRMH